MKKYLLGSVRHTTVLLFRLSRVLKAKKRTFSFSRGNGCSSDCNTFRLCHSLVTLRRLCISYRFCSGQIPLLQRVLRSIGNSIGWRKNACLSSGRVGGRLPHHNRPVNGVSVCRNGVTTVTTARTRASEALRGHCCSGRHLISPHGLSAIFMRL